MYAEAGAGKASKSRSASRLRAMGLRIIRLNVAPSSESRDTKSNRSDLTRATHSDRHRRHTWLRSVAKAFFSPGVRPTQLTHPPTHRTGKTTLSQAVTTALNGRHAVHDPHYPSPIAAFVPMDGYHLTRAQLSAMPDPATAHARRGAEFTFDGAAFAALVRALRAPLPVPCPYFPLPSLSSLKRDGRDGNDAEDLYPRGTVFAPSFDHALKDPRAGDIPILPSHRVVVFEGNYVALDREPWRDAAALMDEIWFVEVDPAVARRRLARRHVEAGIVATEEEGDRRAVENDLPNGDVVLGARVKVDEIITSREDGGWVHE